jgi:hypothetical protein
MIGCLVDFEETTPIFQELTMRYATALVAALALSAAGSLYTPKADAGVVVSVGVPVPVVAPSVIAAPAPYYPYGLAPAVGFGVACCGPAFRGPGFYHPGFVRGYVRGGYVHGGVAYGGYRR